MQTQVSQPSSPEFLTHPEAEEYLTALQTLAQELERAMSAIVARQLPVFEESVTRQLAYCAKLVDIPAQSVARRSVQPQNISPMEPELALRIGVATGTLVTLNQRYAALLKHSGDTLRLFASLFRSYSDHAEQGSGLRTNHCTWSCEL